MKEDMHSYNAMADNFVLTLPTDNKNRRMSIAWLLLAISSLLIAGLFTILIVLSRTPFFQDIVPWTDFFHTALVVHVDLTVLVWFLAYAGMFWTLNSRAACFKCGWLALFLSATGMLIIILAPFLGAGMPFMNNYVPVLRDPVFFAGLGLFGLGFAVLVLRGLFFSNPVGAIISGEGAIRFGLYTALISAVVAIAALLASWYGMPATAEGEYYYELLFWGAGHTVQFVHVQLMLVAWLCLATFSGIHLQITPRIVLMLFAIGLLPVLMTPLVYILFDVGSADHLEIISLIMKFGGGLAAAPVGVMIIYSLFAGAKSMPEESAAGNALLFSILLFAMGGVIGYMISGSNVIIPAHYHGSIVAVTLAFMGITFHLLPGLGFTKPQGKLVKWQPVIYGSGQFMHVLGLAWSGGYGVQRKTAGVAQQLDGIEKIAGMGLMGLGGMIAIVGGILFLIIVFQSIWPSARKSS
ncbi:MAG: cbb3-type cytochrome c oxidase subunit I [Gammaproteobacteria bacterium]|nr:cbb3-type cytochrome c oxidase subunit I [Gammaproteobacteria bacterium]